jgi:hypothetical protein
MILLGRLILLEQELYLETLPRVCMTLGLLGDAQLFMAPVLKWASEGIGGGYSIITLIFVGRF